MFTNHVATVLIVDDTPANISVLFDILTIKNYKVLVAEDGESAVEKAQHALPDIILLDIMMPGMDGFQTCYQLKQDERTRDIPVIFMTALSDTSSKVKGFSLGGVDYVTKPFQHEEVLARIRTHLIIRQLQKDLEHQNEELDAFSHTVAHDLKNPLSSILAFSSLLTESSHDVLDEKASNYLNMLTQSAQNMQDIINALLLLAGLSKQMVEMEVLDMGGIVSNVQQRMAYMYKIYNAEIIIADSWPECVGYGPWVKEIWANYLSNGLKYGGRPPKLELGATQINKKEVCFWVKDNGEGISSEAKENLFTPFTQLQSSHRDQGHGLGLSIVQRIAEKLRGKVGVDSELGQGSSFYFTLPLA